MSGHTGAVVQLKFSPDGDTIYTASTDKTVWIWETLWLSIRCNYYQVGVWDTCTGERIKRMKGHTSFVNSVDCSRGSKPLVVSGGDDCQVGVAYKTSMEPLGILKLRIQFSNVVILKVKVWDRRRRQPLSSLNSTYQVNKGHIRNLADLIYR